VIVGGKIPSAGAGDICRPGDGRPSEIIHNQPLHGKKLDAAPSLPAYLDEELARLGPPELVRLMVRDEDRVPRNVIDECARRGEDMVECLRGILEDDRHWSEERSSGEWWLSLHAAMILGSIASEHAGALLVDLMRRLAREEDDNLQGWLAGYWPALFRNKPGPAGEAARELCADRSLDWYVRAQGADVVVAAEEGRGTEALDGALDWLAGIAADESEDWTMRLCAGNVLLDFPRARHRALLDDLAARQSGMSVHFAPEDVTQAYAAGEDKPAWKRFEDPWKFYTPLAIRSRQDRWAKEDAEAQEREDREEERFDERFEEPVASYVRETPKIGRNDPCFCGSGKKYKHCCLNKLAPAEPDGPEELAWRRLRRVLDGHPAEMLRFVKNAYGPRAIDEAWEEFTLGEEPEFDPDTPLVPVFMPWLFHCWSPDAEETSVRDRALHGVPPTEAYLRKKGARLDPLLRGYLQGCLASAFSFYEITRSDPGRGVRLRDIITGAETEVAERSASETMQAGDVLFGQVAGAGDLVLLEACSPYAIAPIYKPEIIDLRKRIAAKNDLFAGELLREREGELRELYLDIVERILNPGLPKLHNTDGEPLSLQRLVFDVDSAQQAFDALKHLAFGETEDDLLEGAERDAEGALVRASFDWKKAGNRMHASWDNTVLGSIRIDGGRLTAEVNSAKRASTLKALIEGALGERARYRATEIQSVEKLLADAPTRNADAVSAAGEHEALSELPEVKAKTVEMLEKHYERWIDEKIPALGDKTPREAVKDPDGLEKVEALVLQIERNGARMTPALDPAMLRRLRARLGLAR